LLAAAHVRPTTGSNTWPVSTSESQSESNPISSRPVTSSVKALVEADAPPIPTPIRIFMCPLVLVLESDRQPRVDRQYLARDVGRRVGRQEDCGAHDLVGPAEALERNAPRHLDDARVSEERRVALGQEEPRRDRVGDDSLAAEL